MVLNNVTQAFEWLYHDLNTRGESFAGTKAMFNASFTVQDVEDKVVKTEARGFKKDYAEYEFNWYLTGNRDAKEISERAKMWKKMMVGNTTEVNSNYGYFWKFNWQLDRVIKDLRENPTTRRAIVVHYDISELDRYSFDTPCNVALNFYVKDNKLELTVFARSIDLWFGFCNDFYTFARLMSIVSSQTGYSLGSMHWFITNLHIYERHFNKF
jgi:thymidylate synthase